MGVRVARSLSSGIARILVIDDDPKFRGFMQAGLTERGFGCEAAGDVPEARRRIEVEESGFDLILLDVMMPDQSGWEFLAWLRSGGTAHRSSS